MRRLLQKKLESIKKEGHITQHVLNFYETELLWKMPRRMYITEEKKMPGQKPMKDRLTLALCINASSYSKVKPLLVHHSENQRAFKTNKMLFLTSHYVEVNHKVMGHQAAFLRVG